MPDPSRRWALAALCMTLAACSASHRITRFAPTKAITDSERDAYYALPRTLLQVSVKAKRVDVSEVQDRCFTWLMAKQPDWTGFPEGATVAEALGFDPELEIGTTYKLDGAPELAVLAEPDPTQVFRAELGAPFYLRRKIDLTYGPLGVLQSGISSTKDRSLEWLSTAASVWVAMDRKVALPEWADLEKLEQEKRQAAACGPHYDSLKAAVLSLRRIQAAIDADEIDRPTGSWLAGRQRDRIEKIVASLWSRVETPGTIVCLVRPEAPKPYDVLLYSKAQGFAELAGADCSIPGDLQGPAPLSEPVELRLTLESPSPNQLIGTFRKAELENLTKDSVDPQGFFYRIPAVSRVALTSGNCSPRRVGERTTCLPAEGQAEAGARKTIFERDVVVAQLGIVAALPRQRALETQYEVTLDPLTGALVKLSSTREAADPKLLSDLGATLQKEREADEKAAKEAAAAADELTRLERERKLLEERVKIRDYQRKLDEGEP